MRGFHHCRSCNHVIHNRYKACPYCGFTPAETVTVPPIKNEFEIGKLIHEVNKLKLRMLEVEGEILEKELAISKAIAEIMKPSNNHES